jgi:hypothetical protein
VAELFLASVEGGMMLAVTYAVQAWCALGAVLAASAAAVDLQRGEWLLCACWFAAAVVNIAYADSFFDLRARMKASR